MSVAETISPCEGHSSELTGATVLSGSLAAVWRRITVTSQPHRLCPSLHFDPFSILEESGQSDLPASLGTTKQAGCVYQNTQDLVYLQPA